MENSAIPTVYSTKDYNLFHFFKCNRPPVHWKKIAESIDKQDLTKFVPILVANINDKYLIVDGQNRYMACKHLGKPIYYVVLPEGCDEHTMIVLNIDRKNWTLDNFLNFYVSQGIESYLNVEMILNECQNLRVGDVVRVSQTGSRGDRGRSSSDVFKDGKYRFGKEEVNKCRMVSSVLFVIQNVVHESEFKRQGSLIGAVSSFIYLGGNANRLISQLKKYPFLFKAQGDQPHYFALLENIYNYRKRDRVALRV